MSNETIENKESTNENKVISTNNFERDVIRLNILTLGYICSKFPKDKIHEKYTKKNVRNKNTNKKTLFEILEINRNEYYRIINDEHVPNKRTVNKLCKNLNIDKKYLVLTQLKEKQTEEIPLKTNQIKEIKSEKKSLADIQSEEARLKEEQLKEEKKQLIDISNQIFDRLLAKDLINELIKYKIKEDQDKKETKKEKEAREIKEALAKLEFKKNYIDYIFKKVQVIEDDKTKTEKTQERINFEIKLEKLVKRGEQLGELQVFYDELRFAKYSKYKYDSVYRIKTAMEYLKDIKPNDWETYNKYIFDNTNTDVTGINECSALLTRNKKILDSINFLNKYKNNNNWN